VTNRTCPTSFSGGFAQSEGRPSADIATTLALFLKSDSGNGDGARYDLISLGRPAVAREVREHDGSFLPAVACRRRRGKRGVAQAPSRAAPAWAMSECNPSPAIVHRCPKEVWYVSSSVRVYPH
jgi:hypothetical protein